MSPDDNTRPDVMPGVHDFKITMPFTRGILDDAHTIDMIVRLPAANHAAAVQLGAQVAVTVANACYAAVGNYGAAWHPDIDGITATDVDDTPSIDEVTAERDHWRKIVTVLAGKMPGMAQVSNTEYAQADFSQLILVPMDAETMLFATEATMTAGGAGAPAVPGLEPVPDGTALPQPYGGHPDPDVRQVDAAAITLFPPKTIELLHDGQWMPVTGTDVTRSLEIQVTCLPHEQEYATVTFENLTAPVIIRPLTVEAQASDLPSAAMHGRQILTGDGWWTVADATYRGSFSNTYQTLLVRDPQDTDALGAARVQPLDETRSTSYAAGDQVLLREKPGSWWM